MLVVVEVLVMMHNHVRAIVARHSSLHREEIQTVCAADAQFLPVGPCRVFGGNQHELFP